MEPQAQARRNMQADSHRMGSFVSITTLMNPLGYLIKHLGLPGCEYAITPRVPCLTRPAWTIDLQVIMYCL